MGARTRGIANQILSGGFDATDGLSGAISSSNIANASVTNVDSTPTIGGGFDKVASDPPAPAEGDIWFNTTSNIVKGYVLTTTTAAWASGGNLNTARYSLSGAGTQTAGLAFAGRAAPIYNVTEEYDGSAWTNSNNYPVTANDVGSTGTQTAALGVGGFNPPSNSPPPPAMTTVAEYDGSSWTAGGSYPVSRWQVGVAGSQTAAIAAGGASYGPVIIQTESKEYDGSAWTSGGTMSTARGFYGATGSLTASLATGGRSTPGNETATDAVEEYDGTSWTAGGTFLTAIKENRGQSGTQTASISFGGSGAVPPLAKSTSAIYDGSAWASSVSLSTAVNNHNGAGAAPSSAALSFGGFTTAVTASTEEFTGAETVAQTKTLTSS